MMAPIISLSMGLLRQTPELIFNASKTLVVGISVSLLFATLFTMLMPLQSLNSEISARLSPTILDLGVAILSGIAGAYANAKSEVAKSLAGWRLRSLWCRRWPFPESVSVGWIGMCSTALSCCLSPIWWA
ncbi:membrane hypothetical protein [uncultured Thiomicrorhabdus sp.]